ncbi:MAG: cytochrome c [Actinobacteria bacterium]|nr:MAG: cytochrome c [Actinomycetota bacterium]
MFAPAAYAGRGAVGFIVPGVGTTVTRASALASLERGEVVHALLGGTPHGKVLVRPSPRDGSLLTFYVALPPQGRTPNTTRYPIAVVGCGLHGLLTSTATRIPGLVSIADVAHAARHGTCRIAPLGTKADANAATTLRSLDRRLVHMSAARGWAVVAVLVTVGALSLAAAGPGVLACAAAVAASLLLAAAGVEGFWPLLLGVSAITVAFAVVGVRRRLVPPLVLGFLVVLLVVLIADTQLNSLAVLGARPDGGGRFYGITNQLETLLLAPVLAAAAADGLPWFACVSTVALVTVGWSHAGADGGGLLVYAAALGFLALRLRGARLTPVRLALVVGAAVVVTLALVGLDAALGGSSHVTHAVGTGPGSLFGDLGRRLHLSYLSITVSWGKALEFLGGLAALVIIAVRFRRGPTVEAMLVGLAVSFLVNDTPVDIAFLGGLGCWTLVRWESVDSRAMRRAPAALFAACLLVLVVAACGSQGTTHALPETVIGTVQQEAPGKALFTSNGCSGCHTYQPAAATGKIGPDLDKLSTYAKRANQPLPKFVHQSIVDPNAYVEKGYPKGVMPSFKQLSASDITALVAFLTKPSTG